MQSGCRFDTQSSFGAGENLEALLAANVNPTVPEPAPLPIALEGQSKGPATDPPGLDALKTSCTTGLIGSDREAALTLIANRTLDMTGASGVAIGLYAGDEVLCRARAGAAPDVGTRLERSRGLSGECLRTGRLVICRDTELDPRVDAATCQALGLRSAVAVPVCCDGRVGGVFDVFSAKANFFDDRALLVLAEVAKVVAQVVTPSTSTAQINRNSEKPPAAVAPKHDMPSRARSSRSAAAMQALGRVVLSEYFLIALVIIALGASVAGSYRARKLARTPVLDVTRGLTERTVPEEPTNVTPAVLADPEAVHPLIPQLVPGASRGQSKPKPEPEKRFEPATISVSPQLPLRELEKAPEPPPLAITPGQQETLVGVIETPPPNNPKLAERAQPDAPQSSKPRRLSRALNGAKKPAKFLFGKNPKSNSAGAASDPQQPSPAPQPSN